MAVGLHWTCLLCPLFPSPAAMLLLSSLPRLPSLSLSLSTRRLTSSSRFQVSGMSRVLHPLPLSSPFAFSLPFPPSSPHSLAAHSPHQAPDTHTLPFPVSDRFQCCRLSIVIIVMSATAERERGTATHCFAFTEQHHLMKFPACFLCFCVRVCDRQGEWREDTD